MSTQGEYISELLKTHLYFSSRVLFSEKKKSGEKIVVIFLPSLCKENQQLPGFGTQSEGCVSKT